MRLRKYNKSLGWMSLIAGTVLLSGCDSALLDPKGQIGLEQRSLILTAFGLMMIVVYSRRLDGSRICLEVSREQ